MMTEKIVRMSFPGKSIIRRGMLLCLLFCILMAGWGVIRYGCPVLRCAAETGSFAGESIPNTDISAAGGSEMIRPAIGETVTFGRYEQDNDPDNGAEPIEWIVLDEKDGHVLLLSRYALDYVPYNDERASVSWEECTLRAWLNTEFADSAFTREETKAIIDAEVPYLYGISEPSGNRVSTWERVYLLSEQEMESYAALFGSKSICYCTATPYADARYRIICPEGADNIGNELAESFWLPCVNCILKSWEEYSPERGEVEYCQHYDNVTMFMGTDAYCRWWLRSGRASGERGWVNYMPGRLAFRYSCKITVDDPGYAVRPAVWINPARLDIDSRIVDNCMGGVENGGELPDAALNESNGMNGNGKTAAEMDRAEFALNSVVEMGVYSNEPIKWIVVGKDGNSATLMSLYGLDAQPYNDTYEPVTWENCSLRRWLNTEFLETAFSHEEQNRLIPWVTNPNPALNYEPYTASMAHDLVWIPAIYDVFNLHEERLTDVGAFCYPTQYAIANGVEVDENGFCIYWLRVKECDAGNAEDSLNNCLNGTGYCVNFPDNAVRPMIRVKLEK